MQLVVAAGEPQVAREQQPMRPDHAHAHGGALREREMQRRAVARADLGLRRDPDPRRLGLVALEAMLGAAIGDLLGAPAELTEDARRQLVVRERRFAAGGRVERPGTGVEAAERSPGRAVAARHQPRGAPAVPEHGCVAQPVDRLQLAVEDLQIGRERVHDEAPAGRCGHGHAGRRGRLERSQRTPRKPRVAPPAERHSRA